MKAERPAKPKGRKTKRDVLLAVSVIAFIVILCVTTLPLAQMIKMGHDYRKYVDAFTDSLTDARKKGGLTATWGPQGDFMWRLTNDQGSHLYTVLLDAGMGKPQKEMPDREDSLFLTFPDGAVMSLWRTEITERSRERDIGLFVRFTSNDGRVWMYDTDRIDPDKLFESLGV